MYGLTNGQSTDSSAPIRAISAVQLGMIRAHLWVSFSKKWILSSGKVWVSGSNSRLLKAMSILVMSNIRNTSAAQASGIPKL
ncbi:hypothetical protein D3C78_1808460 [compost metagenome]